MTLLECLNEHNARLVAAGHHLTTLNCPHCAAAIETIEAPKGEQWDSISTCPHCHGMYMKLTDGPHAWGRLPGATD